MPRPRSILYNLGVDAFTKPWSRSTLTQARQKALLHGAKLSLRVPTRLGAMATIAASGSAIGLFGVYFVATHDKESFEDRKMLNSPLFDSLDSPRAIYKNVPTNDVLRALCVLQLCRLSGFADPIVSGLTFLGLERVLQGTFGRHFCAGETVEDAVNESNAMLQKSGVYPILDMARESNTSENDRSETEKMILKSIQKCPSNSAIAIKISGLFDHTLLRNLSVELKDSWTTPAKAQPGLLELAASRGTEATEHVLALQRRLDRFCAAAAKNNVILLVDAEQSWFQPGIDAIAFEIAKRHNTAKCVVYNTYQMYLQSTILRLRRDLDRAQSEGWHLGAKVVRGAYMASEIKNGNANLLNKSVQDTHEAYNKAVHEILSNSFSNNMKAPRVVVATHNVESMERAANAIERHGKPTDAVVFAQLKGMQEAAEKALLARGMKVYKYMPYGTTGEVMPYLLRRAQENNSVIGSAELDRALLWNEVKARLFETLTLSK